MTTSKEVNSELGLPVEFITHRIYLIRGQKVMLDSDLAELYQVETFNLNKAVRRNLGRFPSDFMFQMTKEEYESLRFQIGILSSSSLRSQFVTLKAGQGKHRKYLPYVFTEQGIAMLSSVLRSDRAVQVNIAIMRAFVQLRKALVSHADLNEALSDIKKDYGGKFAVVFKALDKLFEKPEPQKNKIGFKEFKEKD